MSLIRDLKQKTLWNTTGGDIALAADEADQVLAILEAAVEFCGSKAAELEESEDEALLGLVDALRAAGEDVGE